MKNFFAFALALNLVAGFWIVFIRDKPMGLINFFTAALLAYRARQLGWW